MATSVKRTDSVKKPKRERPALTIRLSPKAFKVLHMLMIVENAKSRQAERAIERGLFLMAEHMETFHELIKEGSEQGRDVEAMAKRLRPDFTYREMQ